MNKAYSQYILRRESHNKKQGAADSLKTSTNDKLIKGIWIRSIGNSEERIWLAKYRRQVVASLGGTPNTPINEQGGKIIGNRTRPFAYSFRATDKERQIIDEKLKQSGLTMTEFVIRAIMGKPVTVVENASEILAELKRQGNNLNQAVRNSYYGNDTSAELHSCVSKLKELYKNLIAALGGTNNAAS